MKLHLTRLVIAAYALLIAFSTVAKPAISIRVDATEATRGILRAKLKFPVTDGPLTLVYPKWIPGEHGPTGPITDLTGLIITASGHSVPWHRDDEDMYAFHVDVPKGTETLDVSLDFLLPPNSGEFSSGAAGTSQIFDLSWNQVILYPLGQPASEIQFEPSLMLPKGWKFGTALKTSGHKLGSGIEFAPVSLETLIDSPVVSGVHYRQINLSPDAKPAHSLDIVADSAEALEITPEEVRDYRHLVTETGALFGTRHYRKYDFLLTLSDNMPHFGLEHHESSDNREGEKYLTDDEELMRGAYLLCHEMVHSWNGKFRRPMGLATPDYQHAMKGELLWVYEGLTDYLGIVLAARCGLWTNDNFREYIALEAALLDHQPGRTWRSLADTAVAAQLLYEARVQGVAWRRATDFYSEGDLIWLEVDVKLRQLSQGTKSIEDFCRKFHGGGNGTPAVVPYSVDEIYEALSGVAAYDWKAFFQKRVYATSAQAPLEGIEQGGWKLEYTNKMPAFLKTREGAYKYTDLRESIGLVAQQDGSIRDVIPGSPADKAGLAPGMKLIAVDSRAYSSELLRGVVKLAAKRSAPIELLVENSGYFQTCKVKYHDGEKYPVLVRDQGKPDLISEILKPLTPAPKLEKGE